MELVCIVCPNGCALKVEKTENGFAVEGNRCKRGEAYAVTELTAPTRSLTTTVKTSFADRRTLPVRTDGEIPKSGIPDAMKRAAAVTVTKRLKRGDVVIKDFMVEGVNLISTDDL